ncbi:MAG: hypothetical protein B6I20_11330 [Bacteroidetes bacterium 4572_117]|nr:MAG: hypothetical protein B6I20_11330 [Bacteroidetes bacterium 4572_117]
MLNNNLDVAKAYFIKSLKIRKTLNDNEKIAASNKYIADVYAAQNNFDMAIAYYKKALFGVDKNGDLDLLADIYNKVANLYYKEGRYKLSINNALMSLKISKRIKAKPRIRDAHQTLAKTYIAKGDHEKASLNLNYVIKLNQELFNQQLSEKILNISYSMEKEQKQKKINELNTQKKNQFFFIVVLAIVILLGLSFLIISFRLNFLYKDANKLLKHQNSEISIKNEELNNQNEEIRSIADNLTKANTKILLQKEVIEKSHYQITSSINYAKRIQTAILPDEDNLNIIFPEHLLFYKARDIVSGDFYWIKKIENCKIMAVADCTGHGVPGAFLSMLGITLLNEIMQKDKLSKVSLVLDMLRKQIKTSLKQTGKYYNNKDGMDFAICSINTDTNQMVYSGANNPVYIIRKNLIETEINPDVNKKIKTYKLENNKYRLIEIKPDRQPIGSYIKESPFSDIQFKLQKNDSIFLFSDGYYDQFNGETGKKFSNTRFRELLIAIADRKMADQQKMLNETFNNWKKNSPQVDDVLILGVKV